jgi:hypothetical protein
MFEWLRSLFQSPQPAGPPQVIRSYNPSAPTISKDLIVPEGDSWRIIGSGENPTIRLFEVIEPGVEQCVLTYRAQLKSEGVEGKAYLEMWCRLLGGGEFFSKGLHNPVQGTNDWASYEIPFFLRRGQKPDLVKLGLVLEGAGTVWIKDIQLLQTPLK